MEAISQIAAVFLGIWCWMIVSLFRGAVALCFLLWAYGVARELSLLGP